MKPALKKIRTRYWNKSNDVTGDLTDIRGDLSGVWGDLSGIQGDLTDIRGDLSGIQGDLDDCGITEDERKQGVDINDLIGEQKMNNPDRKQQFIKLLSDYTQAVKEFHDHPEAEGLRMEWKRLKRELVSLFDEKGTS